MSITEQVQHISAVASASKAERERMLATSPHLARLFERYVKPMLSLAPESVESFVVSNAPHFMADSFTLLDVMLKQFNLNEIFMALPEVLEIVDAEVEKVSIPALIINAFKEALHLEVENELFLAQRIGLMETLSGTGSAFDDIDVQKLLLTSSFLYMTLISGFFGVLANEKKHESTLRIIVNLSLRYAEEKDAVVTTLDILSNSEKQRDLEAAIAEYPKSP